MDGPDHQHVGGAGDVNRLALAHELGMVTVSGPTCATRIQAAGHGYHITSDLTGQANHLAVTIGADIVKQKQAENNGGYTALKFGKTQPKV